MPPSLLRHTAALLVLSLSARELTAQTLLLPVVHGRQFAVAVGARDVALRDVSESPLRFKGSGMQYMTAFAMRKDRYAWLASAEFSAITLSPTVSVSTRTHSWGIATQASVTRVLAASARVHLDVGLATRVSTGVTSRQFGSLDVPPSSYRFSIASLDPVLGVQHDATWGHVRAQLSGTLISVMDRPYSALKSATSRFEPRVASLSTVRGADFDLSYTTTHRRKCSARIAYHGRGFAVDQRLPVRSLSTVVSAALIVNSH